MQEPKARKDMDPRYLWDLSSIIESAAEFERQFKEAQAQAEEQTKAYLQDIEKQCEQIRSDARVNLTKAADIIVAKVVSVSG